MRALGALVVCAGGGIASALMLTSTASAHNDGCHSHHTCPSDHHTYIWFDSSGQGWDCAKPDASERTTADTTLITYAGLPYYCHTAGSAPATTTMPVTTTTAPITTATTTSAVAPTTTAGTTTTHSSTTADAATIGHTVLFRMRTERSGCKLGANPDRRCSPGAYYSGLTKAVICGPSFRTSTIRHVPDSLKHAVETEYGLAAKAYGATLEIDHIVPLELGGSNDIANLFPERALPAPSFRIKDKLENQLHDLVCRGQMTLLEARKGTASNWQSLYLRVYGGAP